MNQSDNSLMFSNPKFNDIINNFMKHLSQKDKINIRHEELDLLHLTIMKAAPDEYYKFKSSNKLFFLSLLKMFKICLEKKTQRLLFLTIREGHYVILDSWYANFDDWKIESKNRKPEFLTLGEKYFIAKKKLLGIKSLEDFVAVVNALTQEDLTKIYNEEDAKFLKNVIEKIYEL
ncbi:MAG: hypothetical protein OEV44_07530 [Spirochaetota bacterium]|nr:hypothetical protein [Spirochaetota bacterium]